ncbi:MAG: hypothetical protein IJN79_11905 [Clostridia bacterium]|nr:hypothetical protein [Clostridia bacterium]MBQ7053483.1 hypothetical protein [Clostridia bacterium]
MKVTKPMNEPIRLTNKTAIALRKSAVKVRRVYFAAAIFLSVVLCALAVVLGLRYLAAVPVVVVITVLLDYAIMTAARSRYLALVGQAICTEAAAREIRAGMSEQMRREQALSDLMSMKADVRRAQEKRAKPEEEPEPDADPFFEPAKEKEEETADRPQPEEESRAESGAQRGSEETGHRRRRHKSLQLIRGEQAK